MKLMMRLVAILGGLTLLATPVAAQSVEPVPSHRQELAFKMLDAVEPIETQMVSWRLSRIAMTQFLITTIAYSGGAPDLDEDQLEKSFALGVAVGALESRNLLAEGYAQEMSDEEMLGVIAFYESPEGQAEIRGRTQYLDQGIALYESGDVEKMEQLSVPVQSAASAEFAASPAGQALARAQASDTLREATIELMRHQIATIEAHYCSAAECGPQQVEMFRRMSVLVAPDLAELGVTDGEDEDSAYAQ